MKGLNHIFMRIGLDMDEVLAQFLASFIVFHNERYNTEYKLEDIDEFELWKVWGGSREEISERIIQVC
jgi:5'(3')-deoxyribonucleotidase